MGHCVTGTLCYWDIVLLGQCGTLCNGDFVFRGPCVWGTLCYGDIVFDVLLVNFLGGCTVHTQAYIFIDETSKLRSFNKT